MPLMQWRVQAPPGGGLSTDIVHAVSQATQLLNFPLAQEVIRQLNDLYTSLKAPKDNTLGVQLLIHTIEGTMRSMRDAAGLLEGIGIYGEDYSTLLGDLQRFYDNLEITLAELQKIQGCRMTSKFLFRMDIRDLIEEIREELMNATWELLVRLATLSLAQALQNKHELTQVQRDIQILKDSCHQQRNWMERGMRSVTRRDAVTIVASMSIVLFE